MDIVKVADLQAAGVEELTFAGRAKVITVHPPFHIVANSRNDGLLYAALGWCADASRTPYAFDQLAAKRRVRLQRP